MEYFIQKAISRLQYFKIFCIDNTITLKIRLKDVVEGKRIFLQEHNSFCFLHILFKDFHLRPTSFVNIMLEIRNGRNSHLSFKCKNVIKVCYVKIYKRSYFLSKNAKQFQLQKEILKAECVFVLKQTLTEKFSLRIKLYNPSYGNFIVNNIYDGHH